MYWMWKMTSFSSGDFLQMRHLWGYLNLFPIICLILKKYIYFSISYQKKFELIYKDWSKLFVRVIRNNRGLHGVHTLIDVICSWTVIAINLYLYYISFWHWHYYEIYSLSQINNNCTVYISCQSGTLTTGWMIPSMTKIPQVDVSTSSH
jgi:hypothetical protein